MYNSLVSPSPEMALKEVARQVMSNAHQANGSGLFYGRMGTAIFLYHYAQCYDNSTCLQLANQLIEEIFDRIEEVNTVDYCTGLAGIGAGFEYLVAKGFIDVDLNELLSDLDDALHESIQFEPAQNLNLLQGITGLAKYCVIRSYTLRSNGNQQAIDVNRLCMAQVIDQLQVSFLWYDNLLGVIDFLSEAHGLKISEEKADYYLSYAFNKLETIVYEDLHFRLLPDACDPLHILAICSQAANRTQSKAHFASSLRIFHAFQENGYLTGNEKKTPGISLLKQALICKKLAANFQYEPFNGLCTEWQKLYIDKNSQRLFPLPALVKGGAGEGLALLSLMEKIPLDWMDHLVVYH